MKDIFYNQKHEIGSAEWLSLLNEAELAEWNWIQNNLDKVQAKADEFGLREYYYLGRVMYVLSFSDSKSGEYIKDEYSEDYAKFEYDVSEVNLMKSQNHIYDTLELLYQIRGSRVLGPLGIDTDKLDQMIQGGQEAIDWTKDEMYTLKNKKPKRFDYRTAVIRRIDFLFYQMKKEDIKAKQSISFVYHLYHLYKFADYFEDRDFGNDSPLFKRIQTHRNKALKTFAHRLTKS